MKNLILNMFSIFSIRYLGLLGGFGCDVVGWCRGD